MIKGADMTATATLATQIAQRASLHGLDPHDGPFATHPRRFGLLEVLARIADCNASGAMCRKVTATGGPEALHRERIDSALLLAELLRQGLIVAEYSDDHARTWFACTEAGCRLLEASQRGDSLDIETVEVTA
jgi:hypothetical protein